nr:hypothetical protein [Tanacetum cinerariifolium]
MSWTGLPEFTDDTITDYSRPSPSIESNSNDLQSINSSVSKNEESSSSILSKPVIKFVKAVDSPTVIKTNKDEPIRKSSVKYAEMYRKTSKSSNVRGNQRNWNNLKSQQLGKNFLMKNKACFKCDHFDHLAYDCGVWVEQGNTWAKNNYTHKSRSPRTAFHKTDRTPAAGNSQNIIDDKGYWDSGCSRHMTGNISYLSDYEPFDEGYVSFGQGGGKITGKGIIKNGKLEFENVYFVKDLKYNLFSVSQICDNKNSVLFTDSECIVLGRNFKLKDDTNVLLRTPRQHNMYSIDLNNIVPHKDLTCLVAKAYANESMLWHRRLGHLNFKTMNKLVMHNLVKGLPSKFFENDHTYVDCLKGKQHKASCKTKLVNFVSKPLHTLHMDLFGPTFVNSLNHKWYCLVVTDDFSRCDNGGEFRNKEMNDFFSRKGIKREFSNARTPQKNRVAERRNRTLIEAARTMLADAKLPVTFWAEAVNTACYVQNRVLVNKSHNKTPYELFNGRTPGIGFLKPFGCHVMILNTLDHLGKFDAKGDEGTKDVASQDVKKDVSSLRYIALLNWFHKAHLESSTSNAQDACNADTPESSGNFNPTATLTNPLADQMETLTVECAIPTISLPVPTACLDDSPEHSSDTNGVEADLGNMEYNISASPTPTFRIHKDHPKSQIIGPVDTLIQTKNKSKEMEEQSFISTIHQKTTPDLLQFCLFSCFLSQEEPKKISNALKDPSWVEAMQEELLQFKIQNVWILVDCPKGMDVKSAFFYGTIDEEVYVMQPPGFQDSEFPTRVYKVEKAIKHRGDFLLVQVYVDDIIFGSSNPYLCREFKALMHEKFQMSAMGELNFFLGLQVLQKKDGIFLSQDKYVGDILKKFGYSDVRSANTPMDKENPWGKDETGKDVDLHLYKYMIGSLMYLTASRPDIMFAVCVCAWHQVTPKECHLHVVKRIFRYLKGHPKLGLWYPKESPFNLVAYTDSDYGSATQDRKSTTGGCQFLGRRLISWQCKKQIIVATSTIEAEYVAAASGCGQVLWIQNQLLDYGYNFMNTKIYIDNNSASV